MSGATDKTQACVFHLLEMPTDEAIQTTRLAKLSEIGRAGMM